MKRRKNNLSRILKGLLISFLVILLLYWGRNEYLKRKNNFTDEKSLVKPVSFVKVSVLNGCGYPGIATEVKEILLNMEMIDVIAWKNNFNNMFIYDKTIIIAKKNDPPKLNYLMNITGIERRVFAFNENNIEEYYIVLGKDYRKYFQNFNK